MAITTGFVKIAQSGATIDGRVIKPEWILESAETYNKSRYTASVFPEHDDSQPSFGTVEAVRTEKAGDTVSLFADFSPNVNWQIEAARGNFKFTSAAFMPNFAGSGKTYLYSVGATNTPASLGVQALQFSRNKSLLFSRGGEIVTANFGNDKVFEILSNFKSALDYAKTGNLEAASIIASQANEALDYLQNSLTNDTFASLKNLANETKNLLKSETDNLWV